MKGIMRSLLSGMENDCTLPNALKMPTFSSGRAPVIRNKKNRNVQCDSGLTGSRKAGNAHASKPKKYVGINRG